MKKILLYMLMPVFILSLTAHSCGKDPEKDPEEQTDPQDNPQPGENTDQEGYYKFVASPLQGKWNAGDKIYVHGNIGSWSEVVTLSTSDISADGKTATAKLGDVKDNLVDPDGLYAAWPDEAVKHSNTKIGAKTMFSSCDRLITAAYLKGDTFTFIDVSSTLTFSVTGNYDNYAIAANDRNGLEVTNFEVEYTSLATNFNQKQNTGYPFLYGSLESGKQVELWLPGGITLKDGLTIYFGKGNNWQGIYTLEGDVYIEPGKNRDLGNISSKVTAYSGPAPKIPEMGKDTKYTVKLNELSGICLSEDEDFLWGVGDNGDLAKIDFEGNVLYTFHIGGDSEDVSRNPLTGDLLIGLEPDGVGRVKGPDFNTRVTTLFNIAAASNYDNSGLEGLTYYKDGLVFAGTQHNSHLFLCELATGKVLWSTMLYNPALVSEIAGLCYDPLTGWLWMIDSEAKKIFAFAVDHSVDASGKWSVNLALQGAYPIKGGNPESVCVDHKNSCIWVGDDDDSNSYLYRFDFTGLDDAIIH